MPFVRILFALLLAFSSVASFGQVRAVVKPLDAVKVICEEEPSLSKDYKITRDGFIVMQFIGAVNIAGLKEESAAAKISATLIEQRILPRATVSLRILGGTEKSLITYSGAVSSAGEIFPRAGLRLADVVKEAKPTAAADLEKVRVIPANGAELIVNFAAYDGKNLEHNPEVRAGDRVVFDLVVRAKDVSVTGMVRNPGVTPFKPGMKVRDAILSAGGLANGGDLANTKIDRAGQSIDGKNGDAELFAGDRLFVPQIAAEGTIQVMGHVANPGPVTFRNGLMVSQAIMAAGGAKKGANLKKVKLTRQIDGKGKSSDLDLEAIMQGRASDFALKSGDEISVSGPRRNNGNLLKIAGVVIGGLLFGILRP